MHPLSLSGRKIKHNWVSFCLLCFASVCTFFVCHTSWRSWAKILKWSPSLLFNPEKWLRQEVKCSMQCNVWINIQYMHHSSAETQIKVKFKWNIATQCHVESFYRGCNSKGTCKMQNCKCFIWQDLGLGIWFNFDSWGIN